jgi:hypothetical protein
MKKFLPWLLATIILQLCIYFYLNNRLLTPSVAYTRTTVASSGSSVQSGVEQYFSYDGSYRADISKDAVKIYPTGANQPAKEIDIDATDKLTYFSWLQDRNIALVGITKPGNLGAICTLQPVNMDTGSMSIVPTIAGLSRDAEITGVAYSVDTNVIYIQVESSNISAIYRTDANNVLTKVQDTPPLIGRIADLNSEDALLYDSVDTGRVYLVDQKRGKQWISPHDNYQYALIGTDKNDHVYIARLTPSGSSSQTSGQMADMILVGGPDTPFTPEQQTGLPYSVKSITVSYDGKITLS